MKFKSILLSLILFSSLSIADEPKSGTRFYNKCIGGYLFAVSESDRGITMVQVFKSGNRYARPIECEGE